MQALKLFTGGDPPGCEPTPPPAGFAQIDHGLTASNLSNRAYRLYAAVLGFAKTGGTTDATDPQLGARAGMSRATVARGMLELVANGHVLRSTRGNHRLLTVVKRGDPSASEVRRERLKTDAPAPQDRGASASDVMRPEEGIRDKSETAVSVFCPPTGQDRPASGKGKKTPPTLAPTPPKWTPPPPPPDKLDGEDLAAAFAAIRAGRSAELPTAGVPAELPTAGVPAELPTARLTRSRRPRGLPADFNPASLAKALEVTRSHTRDVAAKLAELKTRPIEPSDRLAPEDLREARIDRQIKGQLGRKGALLIERHRRAVATFGPLGADPNFGSEKQPAPGASGKSDPRGGRAGTIRGDLGV